MASPTNASGGSSDGTSSHDSPAAHSRCDDATPSSLLDSSSDQMPMAAQDDPQQLIVDLRAQLASERERRGKLNGQMLLIRSKVTEEVERLEATIAQSDARCADLQAQLDLANEEAELVAELLRKREETIAVMQRETEHAAFQRDCVQGDLDEAVSAAKELRSELAEARLSASDWRGKAEAAQRLAFTAQVDVDRLQCELREATAVAEKLKLTAAAETRNPGAAFVGVDSSAELLPSLPASPVAAALPVAVPRTAVHVPSPLALSSRGGGGGGSSLSATASATADASASAAASSEAAAETAALRRRVDVLRLDLEAARAASAAARAEASARTTECEGALAAVKAAEAERAAAHVRACAADAEAARSASASRGMHTVINGLHEQLAAAHARSESLERDAAAAIAYGQALAQSNAALANETRVVREYSDMRAAEQRLRAQVAAAATLTASAAAATMGGGGGGGAHALAHAMIGSGREESGGSTHSRGDGDSSSGGSYLCSSRRRASDAYGANNSAAAVAASATDGALLLYASPPSVDASFSRSAVGQLRDSGTHATQLQYAQQQQNFQQQQQQQYQQQLHQTLQHALAVSGGPPSSTPSHRTQVEVVGVAPRGVHIDDGRRPSSPASSGSSQGRRLEGIAREIAHERSRRLAAEAEVNDLQRRLTEAATGSGTLDARQQQHQQQQQVTSSNAGVSSPLLHNRPVDAPADSAAPSSSSRSFISARFVPIEATAGSIAAVAHSNDVDRGPDTTPLSSYRNQSSARAYEESSTAAADGEHRHRVPTPASPSSSPVPLHPSSLLLSSVRQLMVDDDLQAYALQYADFSAGSSNNAPAAASNEGANNTSAAHNNSTVVPAATAPERSRMSFTATQPPAPPPPMLFPSASGSSRSSSSYSDINGTPAAATSSSTSSADIAVFRKQPHEGSNAAYDTAPTRQAYAHAGGFGLPVTLNTTTSRGVPTFGIGSSSSSSGSSHRVSADVVDVTAPEAYYSAAALTPLELYKQSRARLARTTAGGASGSVSGGGLTVADAGNNNLHHDSTANMPDQQRQKQRDSLHNESHARTSTDTDNSHSTAVYALHYGVRDRLAGAAVSGGGGGTADSIYHVIDRLPSPAAAAGAAEDGGARGGRRGSNENGHQQIAVDSRSSGSGSSGFLGRRSSTGSAEATQPPLHVSARSRGSVTDPSTAIEAEIERGMMGLVASRH